MPRRLGATVPQTVSRLLQGGLLPQPPAWFTAVSSAAPLRPSVARRVPKPDAGPSTSTSSSHDHDANFQWKGPRKLRSAKAKSQLNYHPPKPQPIKGLELQDKLRQTFYQDHPFEAFKGISLVEKDLVEGEEAKPGPAGKEWTELRQRSSNPTAEDCVDFVINLHKVHDIPLALAYSNGLAQFHSLRATHEIALYSAQTELSAHGFTWPKEFSTIDQRVRVEDKNILESVQKDARITLGTSASGGTPKVSLLQPLPSKQSSWTGGLEYLTGKKTPSYGGRKQQPRTSSSNIGGFGHIDRRS